jgi:hypothetical protein
VLKARTDFHPQQNLLLETPKIHFMSVFTIFKNTAHQIEGKDIPLVQAMDVIYPPSV